MKDSVLITGVAGFIGSHVADHLTEKYNIIGVDDYDWAIAESIDREDIYNDIYNIGSTTEYTLNELADAVRSVICENYPVGYVWNRYEVKNAFCSTEKLRSIINLGDTNLRDGLKTMWEWAKTQKVGKTQKFKNIEISKNPPEAWK